MLSLHMVVGGLSRSFCKPRSLIILERCKICFTHLSVARISDSVVLLAVHGCRLTFKFTGPFKKEMYPDIGRDTNLSLSGEFGFGID